MFSSPHLHTARERIKIGRDLISVADFLRIGRWALEQTSGLEWVMFFDVLLAMALKYFGEQRVAYIILETGIGGRFDGK